MNKISLFASSNLIPTIIQNMKTNEVLMLGYMNQEALNKTIQTGWVYFWSRSRNKLWLKGKSSGNKLKVKKIFIDCDKDSLLISVDLLGKFACHQNSKSCFSNVIPNIIPEVSTCLPAGRANTLDECVSV